MNIFHSPSLCVMWISAASLHAKSVDGNADKVGAMSIVISGDDA